MKIDFKIVLLLIFLISLQSCVVSKHPNMAFFDNPYYDYGNAKFTSVNVPVFLAKPFVKNALREDNESEEVINLVKKIKKVKVMTIENGDQQMLNDFSNYLLQNNYQDWATIKKDGQKINIQALQDGEIINKLMILVKSEGKMVYVDIKGKFAPDDISNLINATNQSETK